MTQNSQQTGPAISGEPTSILPSVQPRRTARPPASVHQRLRRGGFWIFFGRSLGMATVFLIVAFLAKRLTPLDFASYIAVASLVTLLGVVGMLGLNSYVCRRIAALLAVSQHAEATAIAWYITLLGGLVAATTSAAFLLASPYLAIWLECPALAKHAAWISVWIFLLAFSQIIAETFRGIHNLFAAGMLAGISGGLLANAQFFVFLILLSYFHQLDIQTTVIAAVCSFMLPTLGGLMWLWRTWPKAEAVASPWENSTSQPNPALVRVNTSELLWQSVPFMLVNLIALGFDSAGQLIAKANGSELDVNTFEAIWRLAMIGIVPLTMLGLAAASTISEMQAINNKPTLEKLIRAVATVSCLMSIPVLLLLMLFGRTILSVVFTADFAVGGNALVVLCFVQIIRNWAGPCDVVLMMTGHQRAAFGCFLLASPILLLGPWAVAHWGVLGITLVIAAAVLASRLMQYAVVRRNLNLKPHADFSLAFFRTIWRFLALKSRATIRSGS